MPTNEHTTHADFFLALETRRTQALVRGDLAEVDALHAPEYELITPGGKVFTREHYVAAIAEAPFYTGWDIASELRCRVTEGAALVRYQARLHFPSGRSITCWHTDLYERRSCGWQAVWSQATEVK
jgi:hypothetical protein